MPTSACVVIGCDTTYADKVTRRHRFPKDTIRFNIWVQRSGNNNLLNKTVDDVYKSFVMCDKHFEPCYKSFGLNRLNTNAVPTLNLPGDRLVPKLTDAHVYEEKMKKMKVSHAAQVFSQRVGAIMKRIAVMSNNCTPSIDREAADTGQLCLFVDNLFDSANGNVIKPTPGKDLRSAVTLTSPHWVFWSKALDVLRSMKYETKKKIPSISNWISTIQGLQIICKLL